MNSSSFFFRVQALPLEWALLHNRRHPILPDHQRRVWLAIASDHWLWVIYLYKLGWPVPDYSTICRRQKTLTVDISYPPRRGGLHLLVDSTGVKMLGEGEWKTKKHGAEYRRQWRKVHLGIDSEYLGDTGH